MGGVIDVNYFTTEADFDDAWDDVGPFEGAKLKLRDGDNSVDDLDAELDSMFHPLNA